MEKGKVVSGVAHDLNVAKISLLDVRTGRVASKLFKSPADANINVI